ncbi:sigma factor-like helix-turn-helix DNA-binding protein [Alicyclobacillus acidocaldarius]|uniref:Transcriptional regulator, LuxR family n=1 Tax=Alicyclobacillus acidocaldarius (strain Tc-4-1) TaxID=1048834 RepID=F8ILB5_ALIAT|nr:sigma factor-like helix-turn-helix DNA-binding protein [Alicyclobacillus acidocaldarius]AEJ43681.1 transcriptional regulator, LuxR family [Alicyclobacillus acidocaldarius subsp. acidocaldarius Tc-4-1]
MRPELADLIVEYEQSLEAVKSIKRARQKEDDPRSYLDVKYCESMIDTLEYTIGLMEGTTRVERREVPIGDMAVLDRLAAKRGLCGCGEWDADEEDEGHEELWSERLPVSWRSILSLREAACLLAYERGMTYTGIAQALSITRGAVHSYIRRAREKLRKAEAVQLSLFDDAPDLGA